MILGSTEIDKLIQKKKLLENYLEENIEGAGVDLRVGKIFHLKSGAKLTTSERVLPEIEEINGRHFVLKPDHYVLIQTMEKVNMPLNICARMLPRSTIQRSGVYQFHAFIDPGYSGTLTFGMKNLGKFDFEFEKGTKIAQIIFELVKGKTKAYKGKYQGGKVT
ncbi:TPA: dCTP deaminase [archaeon]|uniref:dCTP deaminase n=1 Tax=Candidatus Naiadarchaeum limnaeum TaxID=2756139 RepID=A0A832V1I3_9ARCH|nr:dCTP deaminase [Candidatus Naiadarchaeales archaeon SRR2090153.bin1042]HIK00363.1 dCTP deaminase [Candidatus Naiadarchaeum limnaeum]